MNVRIYTLQKTLYEGPAEEIMAKTSAGDVSILSGHEPLLSMLLPSELRVKKADGEEQIISIPGGFLEVRPDDDVVILVKS